MTEALIRLRAFAFSHDRLLAEVAGDGRPQAPAGITPRWSGALGPGTDRH